MRFLTSIESTTSVLAEVEFQLTATDQSTTWIFTHDEMVAPLPSVNWQTTFGGGVAKTSNYNITLSTSLGFIKNNISNLANGEATLKVTVNSDTYYPHVGRVRTFQRQSNDPNLLQLTVYDKFLDGATQFPVVSITDSYASPPDVVLDANFGEPQYYGKHTRPFYHVAVESDISNLIAPANVSSSNVNSVWFTTDLSDVDSSTNAFVMAKVWCHDSNFIQVDSSLFSGNPINTDYNFVIKDQFLDDSKVLGFENQFSTFEGGAFVNSPDLIGYGYKDSEVSCGQVTYNLGQLTLKVDPVVYCKVVNLTGATIDKMVRADFSAEFILADTGDLIGELDFLRIAVNTTDYSSNSWSYFGQTGGQVYWNEIATAGSAAMTHTFTGTWVYVNSTSSVNCIYTENLNPDEDTLYARFDYSAVYCWSNINSIQPINKIHTLDYRLNASVNLYPSNYKNYSIYSVPVNCSEIAVSENPIGIIKDVLDQTSFTYVAAQASDAQASVESYNFQCYFDERQPVSNMLDEFGQIAKTYMWLGDSGSVNFRTYENSDTVTTDASITLNDMLSNGFNIVDNPLGTTRYNNKKADSVILKYNYDFQKKSYQDYIRAYRANNAFCNSANAAGIRNEITIQTKHILETDTASFYHSTLVKKFTQDESFINLQLPAKFFSLEIADVLHIEHPMIVGSESLYQITQITQDLQNATVAVVAQELTEL